MNYYNLKNNNEVVSFAQAVRQGLGKNQGLFFPKSIQQRNDVADLMALPFNERNIEILTPFVAPSLSKQELTECVNSAFQFGAPTIAINEVCSVLELFHGPTLAFKDFGARFMAQCLTRFSDDKPITILTATSGDTGAAVAHAFHGLPNIRVVVLYPKGKISVLQEKLFTTIGGNIETIAIEGSFDDCQQLVKTAFDDQSLVKQMGLNSANSINISRLLAQVCYYFEAFKQLTERQQQQLVVSVPSGNFGNITAGLIAKTLGLPIKRMVAATNANDTIPRFMATGKWHPQPTVATLSNAMDVSKPNNWPRIEYLLEHQFLVTDAGVEIFESVSVDEKQTESAMRELEQLDYLAEPHAAVAFSALKQRLLADEYGVFLGTAHPAKFKDSVDAILQLDTELPDELRACVDKESLSITMNNSFAELKGYLVTN